MHFLCVCFLKQKQGIRIIHIPIQYVQNYIIELVQFEKYCITVCK